MKPNRIIALLWLAGLLLFSVGRATAADVVPCLIFTGNSETEHCIDLAALNRITFGDDGMIINSSKDDSVEGITLLYALFNHLEIGDATPTDNSGSAEIIADDDSHLLYRSDTKSLTIEYASDTPFTLGIFNFKGAMIATSQICAGQSLSVEALASGAYIAVATNGETTLKIKFIHN